MTDNPSLPAILAHDNLDDRKEVAYLLQQLPPRLRVRWLKWCCARCALPNTTKRPVVPAETTGELEMEIFFDFWSLVNTYRLDPLVGMNALVQVVRAWKKGWFGAGSPVKLHLPR